MMTNDHEYISYRIARARELMADDELLSRNERWRSGVNRLYYASFQLIGALLFKEKITTKTHEGLKTKFFQLFIKTGKIDKKYGKLYSQLIDWRQESDYSEIVEFHKEDVVPLFEKTQEFNELLINQLESHLGDKY